MNAGTGNVVANNVFSDNGFQFNYRQLHVLSGTGNEVVWNVVWSPTASRQGVEVGVTGNTVNNNLSLDPLFVTPSTDLHLASGSPARGAGTARYRVAQDYDDELRAAAPSMGAFE